MKIALYGANGYFGSAFRELIAERGWMMCPKSHTESLEDSGLGLFDAVINASAFVCKPSVELNDNFKEETLIGNAIWPMQLARFCGHASVPLLHLSTGCLFCDLTGEKKFSEADEPHLTFDKGAGLYVGSKEICERLIFPICNSWICRVRLPFDHIHGERNFISKFLAFPKIVNIRNSMSHRYDAATACLDMIEQRVPFGTYHVTNPGAITPQEIIGMFDSANGQARETSLWPIDDYVKTRRTLLSAGELDVSKLLSTGVKIRPIKEAVADAIKNWRKV